MELLTLLYLQVIVNAGASAPACGDAAASAFCHEPSGFEKETEYPTARTLPGPATSSELDCCCACAAAGDRCNGWTLHAASKECYLKSDAGPSHAAKADDAVSAIMPPPPPYKPPFPTPAQAKNVLFLAVDDMRPSLGAYNFTLPGRPSHSPNIDKLAATGTLFTRAYVQYAYCSPSRNSFMTGRRPDTTKVWEFKDHFREDGVGSNWVSMPQFFKQHGYLTLGVGKLYHPSSAKENIGGDHQLERMSLPSTAAEPMRACACAWQGCRSWTGRHHGRQSTLTASRRTMCMPSAQTVPSRVPIRRRRTQRL
jgi:hypothetical protein